MERIALLLVKLKPYAVLQLLLRCESTMQSIYIYHSDNHVNAHPDQFYILLFLFWQLIVTICLFGWCATLHARKYDKEGARE